MDDIFTPNVVYSSCVFSIFYNILSIILKYKEKW